MKKKFFVPLCLFVAMASCNKSVLEETTVAPDANEVTTNVVTASDVVYFPQELKTAAPAPDFVDGFADLSNWTAEDRNPYRSSLIDKGITNWYQRKGMASISLGRLVLSSKKSIDIQTGDKKLICASVKGNQSFGYGFFVANMRLQNPFDLSSQSSFWLSYADDGTDYTGAQDGAEIDVFESSWLGDQMKSNIHVDWFASSGEYHKQIGNAWTATGSTTNYRQYGVWWKKGYIGIYLDGVWQNSTTDPTLIPDATKVKEFMKLSTGAAWGNAITNFASQPDGTTRNTYVDWVRHYTM